MADETLRINRVGISGPEQMFFELADTRGITVEARIIAKVRDWESDLYSYRLTFPDGSVVTDLIPWDMSTFAALAVKITEKLGA